MKKNHLKILVISISLILSISCSPTNGLTLPVTEPAPILLNKQTSKIGIINRSLPEKSYEVFDAVDKILTAEGKDLDKLGSYTAVENLKSELLKNNKIERVVLIDTMASKKYGIDQFTSELSWQKVNEICKVNDLDAIYELSYFDTDSKISYRTIKSEAKNAFGLKIPIIEHEATIKTLIKSGWRIYDNNDKAIVDVYSTNKSVQLNGRGINPIKAFETIQSRKDIVLSAAKDIGANYATQIMPYRIRVNRDYYVKGTSNFEIAKRRAQAGQWDSAAELWLMETKNSDPKIAGRACYNMGIINEINGNLDTAIEWTTKSYTDYGDKIALRYLNVLKKRKAKNEQLLRETN
ncbi:DUF6340 domain-containing protein [Flavobacterium cucumis]|uniref:Tetratricopeptide repeat-containing protein n=1 Tax=Flavobacterium cucumis TaxID=416016 RepID=A0A1M7ZSM8_9FLAO|nr:DUF6340 family protein [Flavobacterium cucumis]SHO71894.1 hypothetical protein SAMN05443547_0210 [Flavobacterium cucumis]